MRSPKEKGQRFTMLSTDRPVCSASGGPSHVSYPRWVQLCKLCKVRCSLSVGRKWSGTIVRDLDEEEESDVVKPRVKRMRVGVSPTMGLVSVQVSERASSVL